MAILHKNAAICGSMVRISRVKRIFFLIRSSFPRYFEGPKSIQNCETWFSADLAVFTRPFFLFAPFAGHPSSTAFLGTVLPFLSSRSALFCRVKDTAQSLERGSFRMNLSQSSGRKFLPEICVWISRVHKPWSAHCELKRWNFGGWRCLIHGF